MDQPGIMAPMSFPIRDPKDRSQINGRNVNPVRYAEAGMLSPAKWQSGGKNDMKVERATNVRAMKDTTGKNVD